MILADIGTDVPAQFAKWMACAAFAVMFTNQAIKLVKSARGKEGHPPNEQLQSDHDSLKHRVATLEDSVSGIHETIRTLPNEIVALLRNTKGLI